MYLYIIKRLQDAFNKYGFEDFICSIVIYVNNQDNLLDLETNYQKKLGIDNIYIMIRLVVII